MTFEINIAAYQAAIYFDINSAFKVMAYVGFFELP